jgi:probable F420-dependent oxidoreductase
VQFALGLPTDQIDQVVEFVTGDAVDECARVAEALGYAAVYVTDHPAPDQQWLDTGGHHALDPMVALSFAAAATSELRLLTNIYVLTYRNPFLAAKSALSLDVLSGGRLILGVAAGYLRSEFNSLGVEFEDRNDRLDEAISVCVRAWTEDAVAHDGIGFRSRGTTMRPRPIAQPHPPIWVGGNSHRAIRRAVERAQGWMPFPNPAAATKALKTPQIETIEELATRIGYAREHAAAIGRTEPLDICCAPMSLTHFGSGSYDPSEVADELEQLAALGVTWSPVWFAARDRREWNDRAAAFMSAVS